MLEVLVPWRVGGVRTQKKGGSHEFAVLFQTWPRLWLSVLRASIQARLCHAFAYGCSTGMNTEP